VEQINYQEEYKRAFSAYLSGADDGTGLESVKALLEKFPFCQSLHYMYAAGLKNDAENFNTYLTKAAILAPQDETFYQIINHPGKLKEDTNPSQNDVAVEEQPLIEPNPEELTEQTNAPQPVTDEDSVEINQTENESEKDQQSDLTEITSEKDSAPIGLKEDETNREAESADVAEAPENAASFDQIEDKTEEDQSNDLPEIETSTDPSPVELIENEIDQHTEDQVPEPQEIIEAEVLAPDSIASADYFTFDKSVADPLSSDKEDDQDSKSLRSPNNKLSLQARQKTTTEELARYDDDKLPYTFLWWLNKTRKEHNETYQPYVNFKLDTTTPIRNVNDELNQQIIENIFQLEPAVDYPETEKNDTQSSPEIVKFDVKRKEEDIIEKFIKEDPQIRPMHPEKISTENKARKSAEDTYDLVSETLAQIYTDQMLFHKAISTYKKLSLKFPEKSAYFADQISELEKKIN
jgi:hypothetical protein